MKSPISLFLIFFLFLGCNKSEKQETTDINNTSEIVNWARPAAQSQMSGGYFTYKNSLDIADTLISVKSSAAAMTQMHESYTTDEGLAGMRELEQVILNPNENLVLKPGGNHLMLMNLKSDLAIGDTVQVLITFAQSGEIILDLPVLNSN